MYTLLNSYRDYRQYREYRTRTLVCEVGEKAARNGLVRDHEYVLVSLELHDDWLEARHQVLI